MIDETDIDELPNEIGDEIGEDFDAVSTEIEDAPVKPRPAVGYKTLGLATIIAALLGAGGGGILSKFTAPSTPNLSPIKSQIETAVSDNKALKAQVTRLQQDMKKRDVKPKASAPKVDLTAIESRLNALETAEPQILETTAPIDPDLVARLEALQSEGSDALDLSDILARLENLETKSLVKQTINAADRKALVMDLKAEVMADESIDNRGDLRTVLSASPGMLPNMAVPDVLPTFPKAAILDALSDGDTSGWLKRTLNKRITVQSEDNPRYLVELIETDLEAGKIPDALMKFDKLPETAKSAAAEWRNAFKDTK